MKKIKKLLIALITVSAMTASFTGCDDDSSNESSSTERDTSSKDYGGYSKEYWDAARDAWDANT